LYKIVRGKLELFDEPSHIQYLMLTKSYIYRVKVNPDGTFVAIIKDGESVEKLKNDFKVIEFEEETLENVLI